MFLDSRLQVFLVAHLLVLFSNPAIFASFGGFVSYVKKLNYIEDILVIYKIGLLHFLMRLIFTF